MTDIILMSKSKKKTELKIQKKTKKEQILLMQMETNRWRSAMQVRKLF